MLTIFHVESVFYWAMAIWVGKKNAYGKINENKLAEKFNQIELFHKYGKWQVL